MTHAAILRTHPQCPSVHGAAPVHLRSAYLAERPDPNGAFEFPILLPETPGVLDDRERGYLHLRTGVAFRELEAIEQAELAYQDQLDILVWESDAIRDQRLGAPFGNPTEDLS